MVDMTASSCPFCPFSNPSLYSVVQHIETIHPEPDEPSFVSRRFLEDDLTEHVDAKGAAMGRDAPSQDYIECECGEAVLLSEFDDHVQLHSAESADMAVDSSQLPAGVTLTPPEQRVTWPPMASPLRAVDLNPVPAADDVGTRPSKPRHDLQNKHDKQHHTVKEWIDLLLGSSPPPPRPKGHVTHTKDVRRLGVSRL